MRESIKLKLNPSVVSWSVAVVSSSVLQLAAILIWSQFAPSTTWAIIFILLVALAVCICQFTVGLRSSLAYITLIAKPNSPLRMFRGLLFNLASSIFLGCVCALALIWQGSRLSDNQIWLYLTIFVVSGTLFARARSFLATHITDAFLDRTALNLSSLIGAVIWVPILTFVEWNYSSTSGNASSAGLIQFILQEMQQARTQFPLINEMMAGVFGIDALKLWLFVRANGLATPALVLYALTNSFIVLVFVRASGLLTLYFWRMLANRPF